MPLSLGVLSYKALLRMQMTVTKLIQYCYTKMFKYVALSLGPVCMYGVWGGGSNSYRRLKMYLKNYLKEIRKIETCVM